MGSGSQWQDFPKKMAIVLVIVVCMIVAEVPTGQPKKDIGNSLQGEWKALSFEANGQAVSTATAGWKVVMHGNTLKVP
jgi:hypothetical protein